jgi:mono/diheme cytochrome c family protein
MRTLPYCLVAIVLSASIGAAAQPSVHDSGHQNAGAPTPVSGESWIMHLSRPFNETSMGKTSALGPAPENDEDQRTDPDIAAPINPITLSGADLYRFNCQGCHGPAGLGVPPEINSVVNPVRATSVSLVLERMKSRGLDISLASANELAKEARLALLKRLREGGENMPSFSYLSEAEIASIIGYLDQLAEVPGAPKEPKTVRESPERVGELIVKSTCHICHSATGPNPNAQELLDGQIPPLEALPSRVDQANLIRKVTHGLPVLMGDPPMPYRGRMPVFYYLAPQEAADVYLYLSYYPPAGEARSTAVTSSIDEPPAPPASGGGASNPNIEPGAQAIEARPDPGLGTSALILIACLFAFVVVLIVGGLAFTVREFSRMSSTRSQTQDPKVIAGERSQEETYLVPF